MLKCTKPVERTTCVCTFKMAIVSTYIQDSVKGNRILRSLKQCLTILMTEKQDFIKYTTWVFSQHK